MTRDAEDNLSLDLFAEETPVDAQAHRLDWPDPARFPLNVDRRQVGDRVLEDLRASQEPLIVTGYAALDHLIDFIAETPEDGHLRLLLGFEPFPSRRESFEVHGYSFPREVERYWLERGISMVLSAKLIQCIERLKSGQVRARYLSDRYRRLHAKIYVADPAATVGSSNFTRSGFKSQLEANARFDRIHEPKRYAELREIADNYWSLGREYNDELIVLLERLLRVVSWREALARACAELLEGDWAQDFLQAAYLPGDAQLWPSQRQGIAQALYVLSRHGSVLVADATGSGKTLMGSHLVRAILDHIAGSGRLRKGRALMVCPPAVEEHWQRAATLANAPLDTYSHGMLSHARSKRHHMTIDALRRAQILCVDEGHNFLSVKSNRTQNLLRNMADHVLLFTATPINRSVVDLLRIADMLGADNLEPSTLDAFQKMLGVRDIHRSLDEQETVLLRTEIQKFTVRRTKRMLNALIDREPEEYRDNVGRTCRFPSHSPRTYRLNESEKDCALAAEIRDLADQLYAVTHFQRPIEMPEFLRRQGRSEVSFLQGRLVSAKKIARYMIMALLRSSRPALAEHIVGTRQATEDFALEDFQKASPTGNMLATLERIGGSLPRNGLSVPLPRWLADPVEHEAACHHDRQIYARIYECVREMSDGREKAKASKLVELSGRHALLLAFDRSPITLAVIRRHIQAQQPDRDVLIATGDAASDRGRLLNAFQWGSAEKGIIGLCSDSLAEGVNLQQASCMVHLDMPSVVRIAEQRAGRVDRMDSPHASIEVWWPQDAPQYALASDERFVERYETVESLLGANMPLPAEMLEANSRPVATEEVINEYAQTQEPVEWDGIRDAFEPVRRLVSGDSALVEPETYESYRHVNARVLSRVSIVRSGSPWAFFSLAGGSFRAPHWVLFGGLSGTPLTELAAICDELRTRLSADLNELPLSPASAELLVRFVQRLGDAERSLLPRRKQRALDEMSEVVDHFAHVAAQKQDQLALGHYEAILRALRKRGDEVQPNWDDVASRWLDLIRPVWYGRLKQKRRRPLLLKDIRDDLKNKEATLGPQIIERFASFPVMPPPEERISACILGINL
ncbi:MAG TPA: SNF2-related protein [Thioalkalivibrio sp.]|nr:SNF2-related protein [Thioalkalivibrio sp.]